MKKRSMRFPVFLLSLLCALILIIPAYADMGPKESLNITVINAPEGTIYIDLLYSASEPPRYGPESHELARYDAEILAHLRSTEQDGWYLACTSGTGGAPIFGDVFPDQDGVYHFGYFGLPRTFRIAAASNTAAQSTGESYTRTRFISNLVYDWSTNTFYEATPTAALFFIQLSATLIPTLMIEGIILALFRFRHKRSWLIFLFANVVTQLGLHLICYQTIGSAMQFAFYYFAGLILPEVVIFIVEAVSYRFLVKEHTGKRRILYALCSNLASFILGFFPLHWLSTLLNTL